MNLYACYHYTLHWEEGFYWIIADDEGNAKEILALVLDQNDPHVTQKDIRDSVDLEYDVVKIPWTIMDIAQRWADKDEIPDIAYQKDLNTKEEYTWL